MVTFKEMLINSKKYKDLVTTFEGVLALVLSTAFTLVFAKIILQKPILELNEILIDISYIFIPSLLGLIGFTLSGLAFVSGTVSLKATKLMYKKEKANTLISIFFTFYFLGWIIGIDIILFIIIWLCALSHIEINMILFYFLTWVTAYLTLFIVFYSIGLFHTCINIFFINYLYNKDDTAIENKKQNMED